MKLGEEKQLKMKKIEAKTKKQIKKNKWEWDGKENQSEEAKEMMNGFFKPFSFVKVIEPLKGLPSMMIWKDSSFKREEE